jgi:hypothetical protein
MRNHALGSILGVLAALLMAAGGWWWYQNMELRWMSKPYVSDAARENRLLGATLLLRQNGQALTVSSTLGELAVPKIADGTLIMADAYGIVTPTTAQQLLAWVRRGNTLVLQPRNLNRAEEKAYVATLPAHDQEEEEDEDEDEDEEHDADDEEVDEKTKQARAAELLERDPISARLGVRRYWESAPRCAAKDCVAPPAALRRLALPGSGYWLELDADRSKLVSLPGAVAPLWSDEHADTVRTYAEGKGRIVMLAEDFFSNDELKKNDHAELLLALAALNRGATHVTLVQHLDVLPWYQALWINYQAFLVSLACCLALALWAALRRFGPLLPQPAGERRSLMEHIDASGAWLWKAEGGRQLLLEAAREETLALVRRREPKLARLPAQQMAEALARLAGLDQQHVMQALQQDAAPQVAGFTRQIRTLQELRNHYER